MHEERKHDSRWWREDSSQDIASVVFSNIDALKADHQYRLEKLDAWHALYTDDPEETSSLETLLIQRDRRARFNVIQNAIDSVVARITKNKPAPWAVTIEGNYSLQNKAKQLTKYLEGEFFRAKLYELGEEAFRDAAIYGTGVVKVHAESGRPDVERVLASELFTDIREEKAQHVRTLYQVKAIDREVLAEMFPEYAHDIREAEQHEEEGESALANLSDLVTVVEAWHLPSKSKRDDDEKCDGKHVICCSDAVLLEEDWEQDHFPFVFLHWSRNPRGFWGFGLAERMAGTQSSLNTLSETIEDCFRLSVPFILASRGSNFDRNKVTNDVMNIYEYDEMGPPPQVATPDAVSQQHLGREQALIERAYQLQGISQLSAQSEKPAGLNSGKALMVHQDVESERFMSQGRAYEQFYVDVANHMIELLELMADDEDAEDLEVLVGDDTLESIRYSDVRMADQPYRIRVFPVSALSQTPQGKLQDVQDLMQLGLLDDPDDALDLLSFPDLDKYRKVRLAGRELVDKLVEKAMRGEDVTANPYMPLQYAIKQASLHLDLAVLENAPDSATTALSNFIGQIEAMMQRAAAQAAPPPQPGPPAGPMGPPQAGPPMAGPMGQMPMGPPSQGPV